MREIEFRGKEIKTGKWVYGDLQILGNRRAIFGGHRGDNLEKFKLTYEIDLETVGEYTGLKDKNNVKIFEEDVVRIRGDNAGIWAIKNIDGGFCAMRGEERFAWCRYTKVAHTKFEIEIIGNIHDSPELLKESDNA